MREASHACLQLADQVSGVLLWVSTLTRLIAQTLQLRPLSCDTTRNIGAVHFVMGAARIHILRRIEVELI